MHTFAQKPKACQQTTSAKPALLNRTHFGQSHNMNSILHLQRTIGNQAVQRMLQTDAEEREADLTRQASHRFDHDFSRIPIHPPEVGVIQTKLAINKPGDSYEQEANRVAERVMGKPESHLQHACACDGGCPKCQTEMANRECHVLQTKRIEGNATQPVEAPPIVHKVLRSAGHPLDTATKAFFEPRFAYDLSRVRVHADTSAAESAQALGALAYTVGQRIAFAPGQYLPHTSSGMKLLAHELAHVVQSGPPGMISRQTDPRHERGYFGEQEMGFRGYRWEEGWVIIEGPSGAPGHTITASGFDAVAYNVRTGELHIVDNKSFARAGAVSSATAIDPEKNLLRNLEGLIRRVESMSPEQLPQRQQVLRLLRQTRAALRGRGRIPGRVRLVVTAAGGRSTGVSARLQRAGVVFRDINAPAPPRPGTARAPLEGGRAAAPREPAAPPSRSGPVRAPGSTAGGGGGARGAALAAGASAVVDIIGAELVQRYVDKKNEEFFLQEMERLEPQIEAQMASQSFADEVERLRLTGQKVYVNITISIWHQASDTGVTYLGQLTLDSVRASTQNINERRSARGWRAALRSTLVGRSQTIWTFSYELATAPLTPQEREALHRRKTEQEERERRQLEEAVRLRFEECMRRELERPAGIPSEEEQTSAEEKCISRTGYIPISR